MTSLNWQDRCCLAQTYAPYLVLFPEEQALGRPAKVEGRVGDYHPRGVGPLIDRGKLALARRFSVQLASLDALAASKDDDDQLLILTKLVPDPNRAWQSYFDILDAADQQGRAGRERFPVVVYARVLTRAEANTASRSPGNLGADYPLLNNEVGRPLFRPRSVDGDDIAIQYWFCYYYDDWANQHEGDWEGIAVFLRRGVNGYEPTGASYYAHDTGKRRHWADVGRSTLGSSHPLVYVAAGSHASYFEYLPEG